MGKQWTVFANLSHISGLENAGKVRDYAAYLFRENEYVNYYGSGPALRAEALKNETETWEELLTFEKRIDSRLQSRLIIPFPNNLSKTDTANLANQIQHKIKSYGLHCSVIEHKGKGKNRHFHAVYSDRDLKTKKKNRDVQKKSFLQDIKRIVAAEIRQANLYKTVEESNENGVSIRLPMPTYHKYIRGESMKENEKVQDWLQQVFAKEENKRETADRTASAPAENNRIVDISLQVNIKNLVETTEKGDASPTGDTAATRIWAADKTEKKPEAKQLKTQKENFDIVKVYASVVKSASITSDSVFDAMHSYAEKHQIEALLSAGEKIATKYIAMFAERLILYTISHASDGQRESWGIHPKDNKEVNKLIKNSQDKFSKMRDELSKKSKKTTVEKWELPGPRR
jgi:hypothetical protein